MLPHADTVALLRAAQRQGMPPIHFAVFSALLGYCNWRGLCHPGQRALAKLCSVNKDTITASVAWLEEKHVLTIDRKDRKCNMYEILKRSHWKLSGSVGQCKKGKLSGSTAQFAVRPGRTVKLAKLQANCPVPSDVIRDTPDGVIGAAVAAESIYEPSATVNGHKLAFG